MNLRTSLTALLILFIPLTGFAAKKPRPLILEVTPSSAGLPLVTLKASGSPLFEVTERLAKKLNTTIDITEAARLLPVTSNVHQQPLDTVLHQIAPKAWLDGILTGGNGRIDILAIHLRTAGEPLPSLEQLRKRSSDTVMFFGNTEDPGVDPFEGRLEVAYRQNRLRVFAKAQPLSVVVARIADVLGIPFELIGDSRKVTDVDLSDATIEQALKALDPAVKLYFRRDLSTMTIAPVRVALQESVPADDATP